MITRLNQSKDAQNWLSMQPNPLRYCDKLRIGFGEVNEDNRLQGRGIEIYTNGLIYIGYWQNGSLSTGNYITISKDGWFKVGEEYFKDGKRRDRGTWYYTDGKEKHYEN